MWMRWVAMFVAPFLAALAAAELLALVGATPDPPSAPVPPAENPLDLPALGVLAGTVVAGLLAYLAARALLRRGERARVQGHPLGGAAASQTVEGEAVVDTPPASTEAVAEMDPADTGAACALGLVTSGAALVLWLVNPYAALMIVPAAHLWLLLTLVDPAPGARARVVMLALGLLLPAAVVLYYLFALHMDPLTGAWYLLLLVTGHAVSLVIALLGCVWLGALCATVAIARARRAPAPHPLDEGRPSTLGPGFALRR
jgi:hypothetical protein